MRMLNLLGGVMILAALSHPSRASIVTTISDSTDDIAYRGLSPSSYFGGADPTQGDVIGSGFDTSKIVVTESTATPGALGLDIKLYSQFGGKGCFDGVCAYYADLFLRTPAQGYGGEGFNYAITLGAQAANGGIGTTGLYAVSAFKTSRDIWAGRNGFVYGGGYVPHGVSSPVEVAPTVLISGRLLGSAQVTQTSVKGGVIEDIDVTVTGAAAAALGGGFDLLWGTGDCANDTVLGTVPGTVPEPASLALLGSALLALFGLRHRTAAARPR